METVFIYTLAHPSTGEIRYVGKTRNPKMRYHNHCNKLHNEKTHKRNWIESLRKQKLKPIMEILDEVLVEEWKYWEKFWISQLKEWGFKLVNHTSGGDGLTLGNQTSFKKGHKLGIGRTVSEETKKKISESKKGRKASKETKLKMSISLKGKNKGRKMSEETREKVSKTFFKKGQDSWIKGKKGIKLKPDKNIFQYSALTGKFIDKWVTAKEAGTKLSINIEGIGQCARNKSMSAGGYIWKYEQLDKVNPVDYKGRKISIKNLKNLK